MEEITFYDIKERERALFEGEKENQRVFRDEYNLLVILEEISWRQKSRALLLKKGDKNTKFFHQMADVHWRGNFISQIKVN